MRAYGDAKRRRTLQFTLPKKKKKNKFNISLETNINRYVLEIRRLKSAITLIIINNLAYFNECNNMSNWLIPVDTTVTNTKNLIPVLKAT